MARGVSVKVATTKVIKALEDKLSDNTKTVASNEKKRKDYEKVEKAYSKEVADTVFKNISKAEVSAYENYRNEVNVTIQLPAGVVKLPTKPEIGIERELGSYEISEIENAIRILKMTDEEFVNASTFKQVAQYL